MHANDWVLRSTVLVNWTHLLPILLHMKLLITLILRSLHLYYSYKHFVLDKTLRSSKDSPSYFRQVVSEVSGCDLIKCSPWWRNYDFPLEKTLVLSSSPDLKSRQGIVLYPQFTRRHWKWETVSYGWILGCTCLEIVEGLLFGRGLHLFYLISTCRSRTRALTWRQTLAQWGEIL